MPANETPLPLPLWVPLASRQRRERARVCACGGQPSSTPRPASATAARERTDTGRDVDEPALSGGTKWTLFSSGHVAMRGERGCSLPYMGKQGHRRG